MKNVVKIPLFVFLIAIGVVIFIYAGIDDSPGGQLIGVVVGGIGVVGLIKQFIDKP